MAYSIIQPPFTLVFREMTKPELKRYFGWFAEVTLERITGLEAEVRRSPAHSTWRAGFSPESLEALGEWFAGRVEARARTGAEINAIKSTLTFPIDVPGEQLTNRTKYVRHVPRKWDPDHKTRLR